MSLFLRLLLNLLAAAQASTPHLPVRLLLAVAYVESRYQTPVVSDPHHGWPKFCGVCQSIAMSNEECEQQQGLTVGYQRGAIELEQWLRDSRVRGDVMRALNAHGCGNFGLEHGCKQYAERVMRIASGM